MWFIYGSIRRESVAFPRGALDSPSWVHKVATVALSAPRGRAVVGANALTWGRAWDVVWLLWRDRVIAVRGALAEGSISLIKRIGIPSRNSVRVLTHGRTAVRALGIRVVGREVGSRSRCGSLVDEVTALFL